MAPAIGQTRGSFTDRFLAEVTIASKNNHANNWDAVRFGPEPPTTIRETLRNLAGASGLLANHLRSKAESMVAPISERMEWVYANLLRDDRSRDLFVKLWAYRFLGHRRVKLPTNTPSYWQALAKYDALVDGSQSLPSTFHGQKLFLMDLSQLNIPLRAYSVPMVFTTLIDQHQYRNDAPFAIDVEPGDYVIDGGGCWGDAALIFAWKAGPQGKVFSFEFVPANLDIFHKNLDLNPELAATTSINPYALWDRSGEALHYEENGPGTSVGTNGGASARTITLDDFCRELLHVDFIKLDIEKAELAALRGAVETLKRFRPKLAISIYHKPEDFWEIPTFINALNLGYQFAIGHHTIHAEETVLYATA